MNQRMNQEPREKMKENKTNGKSGNELIKYKLW